MKEVAFTFFPQASGRKARADLTVHADEGAQWQVTLTRLEASLLGTFLESLVSEEESDFRELVG